MKVIPTRPRTPFRLPLDGQYQIHIRKITSCNKSYLNLCGSVYYYIIKADKHAINESHLFWFAFSFKIRLHELFRPELRSGSLNAWFDIRIKLDSGLQSGGLLHSVTTNKQATH